MWRRFGGAVILAVSIVLSLFVVSGAFPVVVSDIVFEGLDGIRLRDIREVVAFDVGDEILESDLKAASQAIYDLGWFREVFPEVIGDGEIVFSVSEYSKIDTIVITGNVNKRSYGLFGIDLFRLPIVSTTKIKQILRREDIRRGKVLNRVALEAGLREVIAEYNNRGYVLIALGDVTMTDQLSIEFIEGRVASNRISGLSTVPTEIAEEMIDFPLGEPLEQVDLQRVMLALRSSVYFSAVEVVPNPGVAADDVNLHWTLTERRLIESSMEIDDIALEGVSRFSEATADDALDDIPSGAVDNYGLLKVVKGLFDLYQDAGYIMVRFTPAGVEDGTLRLLVEEGRVSDVLLSGNTTTRDHVVLRNLKIEAGDILTTRALRTGYQRLSSFGYFNSLEVLPDWSDDGVRVSVIVTEREDLGGMNGTLAVEPSSGGIVGELKINQKNLFGTGQDISISYSRGFSSEVEPMTSSWTLGYSSIASFPGFDRVGLDLYRSIREIDGLEDAEEYVTVGGTVAFAYPVADYTDLSLSFKHEEERLVGTEIWTPIDSVSLALIYDDVDDPFFPTVGNRQTVYIEKAGGFAAGEEYIKTGFLWIEFTPVESFLFSNLDQAFAVRFRVGWGDKGLPVTQTFHLGGPTSVRGTVAERVPRLFVANFEHRLELVEGLVFTTFFDAGLNLDAVRIDDVISSTGFEFGINAAGIYVRLEFVWVLDEDMNWFPTFDIGFGPMF